MRVLPDSCVAQTKGRQLSNFPESSAPVVQHRRQPRQINSPPYLAVQVHIRCLCQLWHTWSLGSKPLRPMGSALGCMVRVLTENMMTSWDTS